MPVGRLDRRELALRSVADLGTRHRHGGVSCGAQSPACRCARATIVVNDNRVRVSQQAAACRFELRPGSLTIDAGGGTREVAVSAASGCSWTVATDASWISFTTPVTGSGDGSVSVSIAPNRGDERRVGTIVVGDQRFTVTQEPEAPASRNSRVRVRDQLGQSGRPAECGGEVSASVTVASGCAWTASSSVAWVTVTRGRQRHRKRCRDVQRGGESGRHPHGTVTVAGQTFTVTQAAATSTPCTYSISPPDVAIAAAGGTGTVAVSDRARAAPGRRAATPRGSRSSPGPAATATAPSRSAWRPIRAAPARAPSPSPARCSR